MAELEVPPAVIERFAAGFERLGLYEAASKIRVHPVRDIRTTTTWGEPVEVPLDRCVQDVTYEVRVVLREPLDNCFGGHEGEYPDEVYEGRHADG